jgi:hypothetical protein
MKNLNVVHIKCKNLNLIIDQLTKTLKKYATINHNSTKG